MYALSLLVIAYGAESMASNYPFARQGVIDRIDLNNRLIVVNDAEYHLAAAMQVYYFDGRGAAKSGQRNQPVGGTVQTLRQGMRIGFNVDNEGPGHKGSIVAAWVLLPGSVKESRE
jgi:hypothetical protein